MDEFRRRFPNLSRELEAEKENRVTIDSVRLNPKEGEKAARKFEEHDPNAIDFLRRCETDEQAIEIIEYLTHRGEIDEGYAKELKAQLAKNGIESFGAKKGPGYYLIR